MRAGDVVQLRPPEEILASLDERGCLDGLPFMPEMIGYFGRSYRVTAQVARACDTVHYSGVRRLKDTVILDDLRCDGSGHAGCGAQCRLYWKEAWLRPASTAVDAAPAGGEALDALATIARDNARVSAPGEEPQRFRCQATELLRASEAVPWFSARSLVNELTSGNTRPIRFVRVMTRLVVEEILRRAGRLTSLPFPPHQLGRAATGGGGSDREIRPGQLVQIRSKTEIAGTLNAQAKNRGLWFDREMVPYCGQTARVKARVERFIDEGTGELVELKSDCFILDGVVCDSARSDGRWFCPRAIYPWWRVAWLEPVDDSSTTSATTDATWPASAS
jgi:hypothetical protein